MGYRMQSTCTDTHSGVVGCKVHADKVSSYSAKDIEECCAEPPQSLLNVPQDEQREEEGQNKVDDPVRV